MLGRRELIVEIYRRSIVDVIMFYIDPLGRIVAVKIRPLDAGADGQVVFRMLDAPGEGQLVGVLSEFIGVAKEAVEGGISFYRIHEVISAVDRRTAGPGMSIVQLKDLVLCDGLRVRQGGSHRPAMKRVVVELVERIDDVFDVDIVDRIIGPRAIIDVGGGIDIEGDRAVGFCEPMAELEVGAVDIEPAVYA